MNRFLLLALTAGLLSGCQSKRDICADEAVGNITSEQAIKKLGIKYKGSSPWKYVDRYCLFYKN